ncbi:MAG: ABC transporter ATP-binding protein [Ilumatobacter sp.]|uniref:ABC transporter ATP-binding protein n=1 Tax=Ilumatobacter sp. TaxID=1967498 RepID=UPI00262C8F5B|nr:ABC transporter ATP-binding protein [Ilumatobacter sp.]MDJ0769373.1 ABC transporter ATP-binding protein [Ilumatobacter sp.]
MFDIEFVDVTKVYPDAPPALDQFNLSVVAGELFGLVGPSGCGKTTVLRILSGLEEPTAGRVIVGGRDITTVATHERGFALITQQNQLMGKRTAGGNIRFPLEVGDPANRPTNRQELVDFEASHLRIGHLLDRRPSTLSAGERRIVQLARCIIRSPSTLLMDEPLAFLEDDMRLRLRTDIVRVHRDRGLTTLLATASQSDAMAMSDRIAVMFDGIVHQIGTPFEVYDLPATAQVAAFLGEPGMNVLPASVRVAGGERIVDVLGLELRMWTPVLDDFAGQPILVGVRPEDLVPGGKTTESLEVRVASVEPLGRQTITEARTAHGERIDCILPGIAPPIGTTLDLGVPTSRLHLFDPITQHAVYHPPAT